MDVRISYMHRLRTCPCSPLQGKRSSNTFLYQSLEVPFPAKSAFRSKTHKATCVVYKFLHKRYHSRACKQHTINRQICRLSTHHAGRVVVRQSSFDHCQLVCSERGWWCKDFPGKNGCQLPVRGSTWSDAATRRRAAQRWRPIGHSLHSSKHRCRMNYRRIKCHPERQQPTFPTIHDGIGRRSK